MVSDADAFGIPFQDDAPNGRQRSSRADCSEESVLLYRHDSLIGSATSASAGDRLVGAAGGAR
ncbi:hypothetical protein, partial [Mycobacterium tuberculosis]|uniref:hypothetical protein n=1 Tax=Mycobacterium tuberculosis TaxID=1773 RepID=UPI003A853E23